MARPTNSGEPDMATEDLNLMTFPPSSPFLPSSNSMVVYYQGSGQSSMDNPLQNRQQRPVNSGDQSDMATEEHFDVSSLLNLPQWSPPPSPCSSANSMVFYQQGSGQSSMDFVDRPLYIAGDMALLWQKLLQFWMDASIECGPRGGIMGMNKENLPQSLECLGINLLHLYVEDEFDTLLYWPGESWWTWKQVIEYLGYIIKLLQGGELAWLYACCLEMDNCMFGTEKVTMGVWRIGPREWVAKTRYRRHSLESPFSRGERGRDCCSVVAYHRIAQVVLKDAQLESPDLSQDFLHALEVEAAKRMDDQDEGFIDYLFVTDRCRLNYMVFVPLRFLLTAYPDEDFVNGEGITQSLPNETPAIVDQEGIPQLTSDTLPFDQALTTTIDTNSVVEETAPQQFLLTVRQENPDEDSGNAEVEPVGMGGVGTRDGEMRSNEKAPGRERSKYKITGVRIELGMEEILRCKEMPLKDAARELQAYPDEDFVNGEVEPVRIGSEGIEEAEIAESQLNPRPFRKKQRKEKTATGERGNKETTRVENVIPLDKILQGKEMSLKDAAELLEGVRLENPNENSCNDEVEGVEMGGVGTGEGEVKEGKLNCGSSDKGERNEKTPQGGRANNKGTGVRIEIPLEEILKCKEMRRKAAATHLKVSESTFKRICRGYNISRWSPHELTKLIGQSHPNESPLDVDQEQIHQLNCDTELRSNQASMETNHVTVKAKYERFTIKFKLSWPWRKVELEEKVKMRLGLEVGTYYTEYKDEDGELILIGCDDDLKDCIPHSSPTGHCKIVLFLKKE